MNGKDDDHNHDFAESDVRIDLADRYDRMVTSQLSALSNVDTNAWRAARLIGILIGIILTALSITTQTGGTGFTISAASLGFFASGVGLLLISLFFAAVSILNVEVGYGPSTQLIDGLNKGDVEPEDYPGILSKSLSKNIQTNNRVLASKADKLRYTYNFLILGLIAFSAGVWVLITTPQTPALVALILIVIITSLLTSLYILTKQYDVETSADSKD